MELCAIYAGADFLSCHISSSSVFPVLCECWSFGVHKALGCKSAQLIRLQCISTDETFDVLGDLQVYC